MKGEMWKRGGRTYHLSEGEVREGFCEVVRGVESGTLPSPPPFFLCCCGRCPVCFVEGCDAEECRACSLRGAGVRRFLGFAQGCPSLVRRRLRTSDDFCRGCGGGGGQVRAGIWGGWLRESAGKGESSQVIYGLVVFTI